mmetsp:Transcript_11605/g.32841  ORF Transcript_11605/g.32841 Transcript_11605/m.32841 type:complete len:496 (+) Transcript_11605:63-1550(+)
MAARGVARSIAMAPVMPVANASEAAREESRGPPPLTAGRPSGLVSRRAAADAGRPAAPRPGLDEHAGLEPWFDQVHTLKPADPRCPEVVGTWFYGASSSYRISRTIGGHLRMDERLSSGHDVSAYLRPEGWWFKGEIKTSRGKSLGTVRLRHVGEHGTMVSNLKASAGARWGSDIVARKIPVAEAPGTENLGEEVPAESELRSSPTTDSADAQTSTPRVPGTAIPSETMLAGSTIEPCIPTDSANVQLSKPRVPGAANPSEDEPTGSRIVSSVPTDPTGAQRSKSSSAEVTGASDPGGSVPAGSQVEPSVPAGPADAQQSPGGGVAAGPRAGPPIPAGPAGARRGKSGSAARALQSDGLQVATAWTRALARDLACKSQALREVKVLSAIPGASMAALCDLLLGGCSPNLDNLYLAMPHIARGVRALMTNCGADPCDPHRRALPCPGVHGAVPPHPGGGVRRGETPPADLVSTLCAVRVAGYGLTQGLGLRVICWS